MLKLLRRVHFPEGLQTSGPVIKAATLKHIRNYNDLLEQAEQKAQGILEQAESEAMVLREEGKEQAAREVRGDVRAMQRLTTQKEQALQKASSAICTEVCSVVLEQFVASTPDSIKIKTLVEALITRSHSARELHLRANPEQVELVKQALAEVLADQLNLRKWNVQPDEDLKPFELRISATNGSEINVSLHNLLALYKEEIERIAPTLAPSLQNLEVGNESFS